MRTHPLYLAWGVLVLALLGAAEWRGWAPGTSTEVKGVPRTVRDNPGSYRSHYSGAGRYMHGK